MTPDGALAAAQALMANPPEPGAAVEAAEQWRRDVQHLLAAARLNSPPSKGKARSRRVQSEAEQTSPRMSRSEPRSGHSSRSPSVGGAATEDLRVELERRRRGEDGRVMIERRRERRQNIEGRNLEESFGARDAVAMVQAACPPTSPCTGGGCAALAPHLHAVAWPQKFRPHIPEKYDGKVNPTEFLQIYSTSILAAGGDETVMANYFHVALSGSACSWLMNLPQGSISS